RRPRRPAVLHGGAPVRPARARQVLPARLSGAGSRRRRSMTVRDASGILLVEDDAETREAVTRVLADEGYRVIGADRGEAGTRALKTGQIAAVILDVSLPDANGFDLCRDWRAAGVRVPVLMLTARTDVSSRVRGLDAGADDYLGKPFALSELRARLRALLRRGSDPLRRRVLTAGDLTIDFGRRQAWLGRAGGGGRRAPRRAGRRAGAGEARRLTGGAAGGARGAPPGAARAGAPPAAPRARRGGRAGEPRARLARAAACARPAERESAEE